MARRSQCSSAGDNPLDANYLPPHYREEYRLAIDALIEEDLEGYYQFLQKADVVDFLALPEIEYIQSLIQAPQLSNYPEQQHLETGGDGSSDTYWPIHSDLDAPGLDLGWPQMHHFMGPTEVTTLVNPPEPNMPSIKDQARRLIKNAQQVIGIVMDMFTDVDMFADILSAAMRNVAVYILLDEQNAHHFVNMVSNCRVNLQGIQLLRVRTVSGITYHCRTGKSLKGQMMDRFLLTDCRAVLSGNFSFMWSFEKLHRCMAHLFLGQLVSTFDEEFRILFAQSQPLVIENYNPREEFNLSQKRQYPGERTMYREPKKFQSMDTAHPEQWQRQPYDEPMEVDWRMVPLKKQDSLHGPAEMYGRFTPQLSRMDPPFDQGPARMPMMENPAFKRHSYAEGGHGRYSSPFLQQQRVPEPENQGRQFYRGQQPYPGPGPAPGKEADYSAYDKFWNQDFHPADQYSEPGLEQEIDVPDNFDPVRNYLASTRNPDFDQDVDLSFGSPHLKRLSSGQLQASQTAPIPSNPTDEKQYLQVPNTDRKDPKVKRGLRNWRISSYLSAYDNPGDEGLPSAPPNESDPFEDLSNPIQQMPAIEISVPKIPNVREFKVPAIPRASQLPSYAKTAAQEQPKKLPDELTVVVAETKTTPTPSESSSSTTEVEKFEDAELKEPKPSGLRRDDSFRRKYNAAMPRSSRLRSSLIFSSMDQQQPSQDPKTDPEQKEEESGKNEAEQTKLPFASQFLGQRRVTGREPFEWSRYMKSATFDNSTTDPSKPDGGTSKPDDKDSPKNENPKDLSEVPKSLKPPDVEQAISSPSMPQSKASEAELPKTDQPVQPPEPLLTTPLFLDMNDPDNRLMFFKELAAKRKAAKAAEAEKSKDKAPVKPTELTSNTTVKKEEPVPKESSEKMADTSTSEGSSETKATAEDKTNKKDSQVKTDPTTTQSCKQEQSNVSTDSENTELKNSQSSATLPVSAKTEAPQSKTPEELKLPNPAVKTSSPSHPPTDPPTVKREEPVPNESSENMADPSTSEGLLGTNATTEDARKTVSTEACSDKTNKQVESGQDSQIKTDPKTSQSCKQDQTKGSTDSKKTELKNSQSATPQSKPPEELKQSIPAVKGSSPSHPSRPTDQPTPVPKKSSENVADPSTSEGLLGTNATTKDARKTVSTEASKSANLSSVASDKTNKQVKSGQDSQVKTDPQTSQSCKQDQSKVSTDSKTTPPTTANATPTSVPSLTQGTDGGESPCLDSTSKEKVPPTPALDSNTLNPESVQLETSVSPEQHKGSESSSSKPSVQSSSSDQILPDSGSQISPGPAPTPTETISCSVTPSDSSSAPTSSTLSPNAQESVSSSPPEPSQLASSKTLSAADTCAAGSEPNTSSLQSASETDPKESCATTPSEKDVPESENKSVSKGVGDESEVSGSSKEVKADSTPSSLSPSLPESPLPNVCDLESKSRSDISPDTCAAGSEPNVSSLQSSKETDPKEPCVPTPLEKDVPESENKSVPKGVGEKSQVSGSSKDVKAESTPLPNGSDLETKSRSAQNETTTPSPTDTPPKHSPAEISSSVNPDLTPNASQSERQVIPPSELNLTGSGTPAETVPLSPPLTESVGSVLSPEAEKTLPTSNVPTESDLQCGTPESVTSETHPTEPSVPAEKSNVDSQSEVSKEPNPEANDTKATNEVNKTTQESVEKANDQVTQNNCSEPPGEVVPPSTQSKQPKSGQSRYQTSTANVLSSSNLRDDTKLLLGQISANSQSRNEAAKESPVTDDEKEDKADKKAIQEKERGIRSHTRGQPKTGPEREKVLEKIQSMRKERRVYSRFEMAP